MITPLDESSCPLVHGDVTLHGVLVSLRRQQIREDVIDSHGKYLQLLLGAVWEPDRVEVIRRAGDVL